MKLKNVQLHRYTSHQTLISPLKNHQILAGDFNSPTWGYSETVQNGEMVQEWAENELLDLIYDPKLPYSFNSGRWKRGYNLDLIFVSSNISQQCLKDVYVLLYQKHNTEH